MVASVIGILPLVFTPLAQLTETVEIARSHFKKGMKHLKNGEYQNAIPEFQKAYDLTGRPNPLLNMGTCFRELGQPEEALAAYELFLQKEPASPKRAEVEAKITELEAQIRQRKTEEERAKSAFVPPPASPKRKAVAAETPARVQQRQHEDEDEEPMPISGKIRRDREAPPARTQAASFGLPASYAKPIFPQRPTDTYLPPADEKEDRVELRRPASQPLTYKNLKWTALGLAGASLVVGIAGHVATKQKEEDQADLIDRIRHDGGMVKNSKGQDALTPQAEASYGSRLEEIEASHERRRTVAYAGFIGSAVFLGLGGIFHLLDSNRTRISAEADSHGGKVNVGISFY